MLAWCVPFAPDSAPAILDIGAGWGPLSRHLLEAYPRARLTLLDYSAPMLDEARRRLAGHDGRVAYVLADLAQPGVLSAAGGPFDVIVSASTIHHLPIERVQALYREIARALCPGGCFLNLDLLAPGSETWSVVYARVLVEQLRHRCASETGVRPEFRDAVDRLLSIWDATPRWRDAPFKATLARVPELCRDRAAPLDVAPGSAPHHHALGGSVLDHLRWLDAAGFAVDCWRTWQRVLIGGVLR